MNALFQLPVFKYLYIFAGICLFIALVVFAAAASNSQLSYGYSYVLGWIACVFTLFTSVAVVLAERLLPNFASSNPAQ